MAQQRIEERAAADPEGLVEVSNTAGSVRVTAWNRPEVEVSGTLAKGAARLEFESRRGRTVVRVVTAPLGRTIEPADLVIRVPVGSRLDVSGVSAQVEVTGVAGPINVETVSGGIRISGLARSVAARSVSGPIELDAVGAAVQVRSVSGQVKVLGAAGELTATTVSGRVQVEAGELARAELSSTSGSLAIATGVAALGRLEARTVSGGVDLTLPAGQDAHLLVKTFSGAVQHNLEGVHEHAPSRGPGRELEATLGEGSARITVNTFSGGVRLVVR